MAIWESRAGIAKKRKVMMLLLKGSLQCCLCRVTTSFDGAAGKKVSRALQGGCLERRAEPGPTVKLVKLRETQIQAYRLLSTPHLRSSILAGRD